MPDLGDDDVLGTLPKVQSAPEFPISRSSCSDDSEDDLSQSENDGRVDKIYTVGCFDLFHRGHINLLKNMRTLGKEVIEGERERWEARECVCFDACIYLFCVCDISSKIVILSVFVS